MDKITKLGIIKCENYIQENLYNAVKTVTEKTDFPDVSNKTVLIKPNILMDSSENSCITTNPELLRAVIKIVKEKGAKKILVGDSPGLHTSSFNAEKCGIKKICDEENVLWSNFLNNPKTVLIPNVNYKLPIAKDVLESDIIIGISKMKTHQLMYLTGCVKNFFGTVVGLNKSACHMAFPNRDNFSKLIVNLHEFIKPSYSFMDGIIAMEGSGPANGNPKAAGLILGSENDYAVDIAQAIICGYKIDQIPILHYAKIINILPEKIDCTILDYNNLIIKDYKSIPIRKKTKLISSLILPFFTRNKYLKREKKLTCPSFNLNNCKLCLRCVNICPAKALSLKNKEIELDTDKCIRCYCCHEMCPHNAIYVKSN